MTPAGQDPILKCAGGLACGGESGPGHQWLGLLLEQAWKAGQERGWWAGPETAALGLTLALAWRAALGEPCVGTSCGCLPAASETGAMSRLAHPGPALSTEEARQVAGQQRPPQARKPAQSTESSSPLTRPLFTHPAIPCKGSLCASPSPRPGVH